MARRPRRNSFRKSLSDDFSLGQFIIILTLLTLGGVAVLLWTGFHFYREEFPDVSVVRHRFPVVEYHGHAEPFTIRVQKTRPANWVSLAEVSKVAYGAIIVSEDGVFYQHHGYDSNQIRQAVKESWEEGHLSRGASTITQQVVKNVFLERDKNLWRKLKELWLATRLEDAVGKRRILEIYLNIAEWGEGIFGISAAAHFYFGKSPAELTAKEGAFLAMLLPSPKRYGQSFRQHQLTHYAHSTVNSILRKMVLARYISEEERVREMMKPLSFENSPPAQAPVPGDDSETEPETRVAPDPGLESEPSPDAN